MQFLGWMIDIAREQSPSADWLADVCGRSRAAGHGAIGLYLEHRFAYPSAAWAGGPGALTPDAVRAVASDRRRQGLRIIPFLNTLGHMEGFIRSEGGQWLAESPEGWSLSLCPSQAECREFVERLINDAIAAFDDEWLHLGGDEAWQLGRCPRCAERAAQAGKGGLFGEYYETLCRRVLQRGRRPCLWADMLLQHPEALDRIPRETILFDWNYRARPVETTRRLRAAGFDVVCCPAIHTYNSGWCFLDATRSNIDEHAADARELGALGVLVTTWEQHYFSNYASILPLVFAAGRRLSRGEDWQTALSAEGGTAYAEAAELLGRALPAAAEFIRPGTWRTLRDRLVMRHDPFALWREWRQEATGQAGDRVLRLCDQIETIVALAERDSPARHLRFAVRLHRAAVQFVRQVEHAARHYAEARIAAAAEELDRAGGSFDPLRPELEHIAAGGGSQADVHRLERLQQHIRQAAERLRAMPAGPAGGHRPSFETIVHPNYVDGDYAGWTTGGRSAAPDPG